MTYKSMLKIKKNSSSKKLVIREPNKTPRLEMLEIQTS